MLAMIVWLTTSVFLWGAIAYLNWFFYRAGAPNLWRWLEPNSQNARTSLAEPNSTPRPNLSSYRRLLTLLVGACFSCFWFAGTLYSYLSPPERPIAPEASLGYTHFFHTKYGGVYGTYLEYLAINYGIWVIGGSMLLAGLVAMKLKINLYESSPAYPLLMFVASAISMVLCFVLWQGSLYFARS
jgi:hypothetical protein